MHQRMKKGLAAMLSVVFVASLLLNSFSIGVFALNEQDTMAEQIVAQLEEEGVSAEPDTETPEVQPEETPAVSAVPTQQPEATEEPVESAQPEPAPSETAMPEHAVTPEPTETPEPTAAPEVTATPESAVTPAPIATAMPEQMNEEELKQQIEELLEQSYSLTEMTEEELEESLEEINAISAMPMTQSSQENSELQDLMKQLADAQAAMEDMRMAWQAKREGWLEQLPQTGKENSWRYQNGSRIGEDEDTLDLDLPDGVSTFSAGKYWGIDVSHHQGVINWEAVKAAGVDFAVIRCGYGMNLTEQDDKQWSRNVSECERLGIPYGVYFYSYAMTADMAVEEGAHAVRLLQGHTPDLPVFYDMEENRQLVLGNSGLAEIARIFCDIVSSKGYEVGVYASRNWWEYYLTDAVFENWYRWVAEWNSSCHYNGRYEMWQYTSKGTVNGINGNVDLNYWYGSLDTFKQPDNGVYTISSAMDSKKVLDIKGQSQKDGAALQIWSNGNKAHQQFIVEYKGSGYYSILNMNSGKSLDVQGKSKEPGTGVQQWKYGGGAHQLWYFEDAGNGYCYIRSKDSGLYLSLSGNKADNGTRIVMAKKSNSNALKFRLNKISNPNPVADGTYVIASAADATKVLDVQKASKENGANVQLYNYYGIKSQQFTLKKKENGQYIIASANSGKVLDVKSASKDSGANVQQWRNGNAAHQMWYLVDAGDGTYYIRNKNSGMYLNAVGAAADNTNVNVTTFTGAETQKFVIKKAADMKTVSSGAYTISSAMDSKKVLDIKGQSQKDGAALQIWSNGNKAHQQFIVEYKGSGYYSILNMNSGKSLDVQGKSKEPGTGVQQWKYGGGAHQLWYFEDAGNGYCYIRSKDSGLYLSLSGNKADNGTRIVMAKKSSSNALKFKLNKK